MKNRSTLPILALTLALVCSTWITPAHAWPFGKKDKDKQAENQEQKQEQKASDESAPQKKGFLGVLKSKVTKQAPGEGEEAQAAEAQGEGAASDAENPEAGAAKAESNPAIPKVQLQSPVSDEVNGLKVEEPVNSPVIPPDKTFVAIDDPKNPLGITVSAEKLNKSAQLISQKKYKEASATLNPLKDWLTDATEAHINIYKTLKTLPSAQVQAELEKQLALQFAVLRDKAFFQIGMLSIGQNDYPNAIKNLSRVIQSQPRSAMGAQAYEVLQKIGFTEKIQLREEKKVSKADE